MTDDFTRQVWRCAVTFTLALLLPFTVAAQEWPKKTLTLVVGFAPGGAADTAARLVARQLQDKLGQTVVVDNRAGAGGNIAHQFVARAEPDGATILLGSVGPLAIAPHLGKLGYDPQKDLAPLTMGMSFPNVLVVNPGVGARTLAQYIAIAKKSPGKLDYASTGTGSASHLADELLDQVAGIETVHVPYKGGAPALADLLAGRVAAYFSTWSTAQPHVESGKLIPLASTGLSRPSFLPNIPTVAESGYPGFNATNWYAFVAPAKVPLPILDRWQRELVSVLATPDVRDELVKHGLTPVPGSREALAATIAAESLAWGKLIRARKIVGE